MRDRSFIAAGVVAADRGNLLCRAGGCRRNRRGRANRLACQGW